MSKKVVFNSNEVVTNEDVQRALDWRARDLHRWLEAILGTFGSDPGTGVIEGGAIMSGLDMTFSSTNLDITLSPGSALLAIGGADASVDNSFQTGTSESATVLSLPVADAALYRWDLVECSVSQVTTRESRQVLSTGPLRTLSPTDVDKFKENILQFRIRSGTPDAADVALLPFLQPDAAWLPLFAVRVEPGMVTLLGSGGASNAQSFDLRKMLARVRSDIELANGFQSPVSMTSSGEEVESHRNWVQMGNYNSPVAGNFHINTVSGLSGLPVQVRPSVNVNTDKAAGVTLAVDTWYSIFAYRPHNNSGFTSMYLSDGRPNVVGAPIGATATFRTVPSLPLPFRPDTAPTQYMGSVRLALSGSTFLPRHFRQNGGYVAIGSVSRLGFAGAVSNSEIFNSAAVIGLQTINLLATGDGVLTVPPHCGMARVAFEFSGNPILTVSFSVFSFDDYLLYSVNLAVDDKKQVVLDIPLDNSTSSKEFKLELAGSASFVRAYVLGYYEETP
jgi:hypothetical protein